VSGDEHPIVINGPFFKQFIKDSRYGNKDVEVICATVCSLLGKETNRDKPGMLLGKIQSGKTKTFIAILALAFDNGFDGAIILTKGTKALSKQTIERITKEFRDFTDREMLQPFDVMTMPQKLTGYEISQKLVFVAKKQPDNMARLIDCFSNPSLSSKKILIVDDEADYASIGFKKTKEEGIEINTTTKQIDELRKLIKNKRTCDDENEGTRARINKSAVIRYVRVPVHVVRGDASAAGREKGRMIKPRKLVEEDKSRR
jgi:hypothetical protein